MNEGEIEILYNIQFGGWGITKKAEELYKLKKGIDDSLDLNFYDLEYRTDPILIEIYKELGDEFDDKYSKTRIKKIPKKYKNYYEIEEYDGKECVQIDYTKYMLDTIYTKIKEIIESPDSNNIKIHEIEKIINGFEINRCKK
jgi:hypothetical protein